MPKNESRKVKERKKEILTMLKALVELSTSDIADMLDCTLSEAFYTLKKLEREGLIKKRKHKGKWIWKLK